MLGYTRINDIDFSKITLLSSGQKRLGPVKLTPVLYDKKPLKLVLPKLKVPFGITTNYNCDSIEEIKLSLGNNDDIINKFQELDKVIITRADELGVVTKEAVYTYTVTEPKSDEFTPIIKAKISIKDHSIDTMFFDENKHVIGVTDNKDIINLVKKGSNILSVLECYGLRYDRNTFSLLWKLEQVQILRPDDINDYLKKYAFDESDGNVCNDVCNESGSDNDSESGSDNSYIDDVTLI